MKANLFDRTIAQLDTLVVFLALEREEIFTMLTDHQREWLPEPDGPFFPGDIRHYQVQVSHSAFLLGYSYMEAFLADLAREIYRRYPQKLDSKKTMLYRDIVAVGRDGDIFEIMIDRELRSIFAESMTEILNHLQERLDLPTSPELKDQAQKASYIRNCLLHNGAIVDRSLSHFKGFTAGDPIRLTSSDVQHFGIVARRLAHELWSVASTKQLKDA